MNRVAVLGSANADLVVEVARRPGAGETLLGSDLRVFAGGKGANQAAAASRAGAITSFHACIGADEHGEIVLARLVEAGVDVSGVRTVDRPTGTALILVTPDGENSIVVSPGANHALDVDVADAGAAAWAEADILVLGLEIPMRTVEHVAASASRRGVRVVLNAAPALELGAGTLSVADPLVVNEHEARSLLDEHGDCSSMHLAARLLEAGARSVVITLGEAGAVFGDRRGLEAAPAFDVEAVDTTGAGDAFVGAVAGELAAGRSLAEAVGFATAVAALSVQSRGAQDSYPARADVLRWMTAREPRPL